jgi:hypothetical protein
MKKIILFILFITSCSVGFSQTKKISKKQNLNQYTTWKGIVVTKKQFRDSLNKTYIIFCDSLNKVTRIN